MRPVITSLHFLLAGLTLSACATRQAPKPDNAELARAIIEENNARIEADAIEAATETAPPSSTAPLWQLTSDGQGLQHIKSAYVCPSKIGDFMMAGDESYPGLGHGNDVACVYEAPTGSMVKLHLTNFGRAVSPSAHLKGVATSIAETYRVKSEAPIPTLQDNLADIDARAFQISAISDLRPDAPVYTAVWVAQFGSWHVKTRATYEADRASAVGALVDALYASANTHIATSGRIELPEGLDE